MADAILQLPGDAETLTAAGTQITFKVRSDATSGRFSITEYVLPPNFAGPPPHVHRVFEHAWYVIDGTVQMQIGDRTFTGEASAFAFVPMGTSHTFANSSTTPARLLAVDTPVG
jgi:mannose-6-phosphate isomerase-like protein (cupin superfamily)